MILQDIRIPDPDQIGIPLKLVGGMKFPQMRHQALDARTQTITIAKAITEHTGEFAAVRRVAFGDEAGVEAVVFCCCWCGVVIAVAATAGRG